MQAPRMSVSCFGLIAAGSGDVEDLVSGFGFRVGGWGLQVLGMSKIGFRVGGCWF